MTDYVPRDNTERKPTFDEVVEYAINADLFGKVSLIKFYEYYGNFQMHGGFVIDWKTKLNEWAARQKTTPAEELWARVNSI